MRRCKPHERGRLVRIEAVCAGDAPPVVRVVCGVCGVRHKELRDCHATMQGSTITLYRSLNKPGDVIPVTLVRDMP